PGADRGQALPLRARDPGGNRRPLAGAVDPRGARGAARARAPARSRRPDRMGARRRARPGRDGLSAPPPGPPQPAGGTGAASPGPLPSRRRARQAEDGGMKRAVLGVVDIGSNTIRSLIVEALPDGTWRTLDDE